MEQWRPIPGFEGKYEASDLGSVRRVGAGRGARTGRVKKVTTKANGYSVVNLGNGTANGKTFLVHRLVALAFLGAPPDGREEVNHIDGVKTNNRIANLEWASGSENIAHSYRTGLRLPGHKGQAPGEGHSRSKLKTRDVIEILRLCRDGAMSNRLIAARFGVHPTTVSHLKHGRGWNHLGGASSDF